MNGTSCLRPDLSDKELTLLRLDCELNERPLMEDRVGKKRFSDFYKLFTLRSVYAMSMMAPNTTIAAALRNKGMSSNISFLVGLSVSMMLRIPREAETKCLTNEWKVWH